MTEASATYARVSTTGQTSQQQLDRLRAAAPGAVEYVDEGESGAASSRPAFDRLRSAMRGGTVKVVYVTKLDRLSRSIRDLLAFYDEAETAGVRIVVVEQGIDTGTAVGRLNRNLLAAFAEFERELISERTRSAMEAFKAGTRATKSGRPIGRPRRLTPELADRIRALRYDRGLPWAKVAQHVGLPCGTVRKVRRAPRSETPLVENPPAGFGTPPRTP